MSDPRVHEGEVWRCRMDGVIEGDRQVLNVCTNHVELGAPTCARPDWYRWGQVEFLELLRHKVTQPTMYGAM